jgi:hypothetical protein
VATTGHRPPGHDAVALVLATGSAGQPLARWRIWTCSSPATHRLDWLRSVAATVVAPDGSRWRERLHHRRHQAIRVPPAS